MKHMIRSVFSVMIVVIGGMHHKSISMEGSKKELSKRVIKVILPTPEQINALEKIDEPLQSACKLITEQTYFVFTTEEKEKARENIPKKERTYSDDLILSYTLLTPRNSTAIELLSNQIISDELWHIYNVKGARIKKTKQTHLHQFITEKMPLLLEQFLQKNTDPIKAIALLNTLPQKIRNQVTAPFMKKHGSMSLWRSFPLQKLVQCNNCQLCLTGIEWYALAHQLERWKCCTIRYMGHLFNKRSNEKFGAWKECACADFNCWPAHELSKLSFSPSILQCYQQPLVILLEGEAGKVVDNKIKMFIARFPGAFEKEVVFPENWHGEQISSQKGKEKMEDEEEKPQQKRYPLCARLKILVAPSDNVVVLHIPEKNDQPIEYFQIGTTAEDVIHDFCQKTKRIRTKTFFTCNPNFGPYDYA